MRRAVTMAAAAALFAGACGGGGDGSGFGFPGDQPTPSVTGDDGGGGGDDGGEDLVDAILDGLLGGGDELDGARALEVDVTPITGFTGRGLAVGDDGRIWVSDLDGDAVRAVDPATGTVGADIAIDDAPLGIAAADGEVWVVGSGATAHSLTRIDAATDEIDLTIDVGAGTNPTGIALTDDHVWIAVEGSGELIQVERATGELLGMIGPDDALPGSGFGDVLAADGSVWAIDRACGRVVQFDPGSATVTQVYGDLGFDISELEECSGLLRAAGPVRLAAFEGGVFILSQTVDGGRIWRIDTASGELAPILDVPFNPFPNPLGLPALVVEEGGIWLSGGDRAVRINRQGGQIDGVFTGPGFAVVAAVLADGTVWHLVDARDATASGLYGVDAAEALTAATP